MFRQKAIDNHKNRWRGRALLLPGIPFWVIAWSCTLFITLLLVFIINGSYIRRINVTGEISTLPRAANVYSRNQGVIVKQFVNEGDMVNANDPIYQIDVSTTTRGGVVSDNQRQEITVQLNHIEKIIEHLNNNKNITINTLQQQKNQYNKAVKQSLDVIKNAKEGIHIMKKNMDNYRNYLARGLINNDQLSDKEALYYQQQNNLLSLTSQYEQNSIQLTILESQIQTQAAEYENQIQQMELQRLELQKELFNIDSTGMVIVKALADGRIDSLSVTVGQMVNPGDSLVQIIPRNITQHYLILWVPNDAIPYLSVGDKVNIRYEAFPSEKFGQFSGVVSIISRAPASPQEMLTYQGAPKMVSTESIPYYKVIVRPGKKTISYGGKGLNLENGMKAKSTLFLEERKIYQWMLTPFYDIKQSSMGLVNE